ncbi:MAG: energy-coupling factor transporter ATPase [Raoultibacter sp.]
MIDFEHTAFTYDGETSVLSDINLHVAAGEFVCVLGGNGSGKSTLAKHINALLVPDAGRVVVMGSDTSDEECTYLIRSNAGMVFQNPDDQLVASLIENDVAFGPENLGVAPDELQRRVSAALEEVGLVGFDKKETSALSGGQKQRVAIAGVLAMNPKILILDEASAMLDPRGRKGLLRVCKTLHERGMTIVMITHFMEEAALADRVVVLDAGHIACVGTPEEVLTRTDLLTQLNLEVPFACKLSMALQAAGVAVPTQVDEARLAGTLETLIEVRAPAVRPAGDVAEAHGPQQEPETQAAQAGAPESNLEPLITFENVSYTYDPVANKKKAKARAAKAEPAAQVADWGNKPDALLALDAINFTLYTGEFLGIAGHTGSGKSTLIQHMNGLLHPTRGRVLVGGVDIADKKAAAAARKNVGVVFQYPEHQLFAASVYEDVAFGPRNLGLGEQDMDARVRQALGAVDLDYTTLRDKSPFELSGGQQRRVAFAGVLAMRPQTLILDEPMAGLDPAARQEFLKLIAKLHESGLTIVMVSHNMDDLAQLSSRILVLKEGAQFALDIPQAIFLRGEELRAIGLGVPAAQRMADTLREAGLGLATDLLFDTASLTRALAALPKASL